MKNILITGAASGLGKQLCLQLAGPDICFFAVDKDQQGLNHLKQELNLGKEHFKSICLDLSETKQIQDFLNTFQEPIDLLVNNAGIIPGGYFNEVPMQSHGLCHQVNFLAPMRLTHHFLNESIRSKHPLQIIQISSASALIGFTQASSYAASKWALLGLSESIYRELKDREIDWVHITVACPSYINTPLFEGARPPLLQALLDPQKLAKKILKAAQHKQFMVRAPFIINLIPLLKAILPFKVWNGFLGLMGVDKGMQTWKKT